jgi:hypothetical protein
MRRTRKSRPTEDQRDLHPEQAVPRWRRRDEPTRSRELESGRLFLDDPLVIRYLTTDYFD